MSPLTIVQSANMLLVVWFIMFFLSLAVDIVQVTLTQATPSSTLLNSAVLAKPFARTTWLGLRDVSPPLPVHLGHQRRDADSGW